MRWKRGVHLWQLKEHLKNTKKSTHSPDQGRRFLTQHARLSIQAAILVTVL